MFWNLTVESLQKLFQIVVFFVYKLHIHFAVFILNILLMKQLAHGIHIVAHFPMFDQPKLQNKNENAGKDRIEIFYTL